VVRRNNNSLKFAEVHQMVAKPPKSSMMAWHGALNFLPDFIQAQSVITFHAVVFRPHCKLFFSTKYEVVRGWFLSSLFCLFARNNSASATQLIRSLEHHYTLHGYIHEVAQL